MICRTPASSLKIKSIKSAGKLETQIHFSGFFIISGLQDELIHTNISTETQNFYVLKNF